MLSSAYFLAKFRFDTAENEPAKTFAKGIANFEVLEAKQRVAEERHEHGHQKRVAAFHNPFANISRRVWNSTLGSKVFLQLCVLFTSRAVRSSGCVLNFDRSSRFLFFSIDSQLAVGYGFVQTMLTKTITGRRHGRLSAAESGFPGRGEKPSRAASKSVTGR